MQPRLEEPIGLSPAALGISVRIGSIVRFGGNERVVLDIKTKIVSVPDRLPSLPLKMTVVEVKIAEGFVPIGDIELVTL